MVEGFQHTEVGIIPSNWNVKKVGECLLRNPDYGINAAAVPYNENLPVYLRITDITEDGNYSKKNLVSVNNISSSSYFLQEGDLVFARTGASVGKTYLYNPKDGKLVFAGFLIRVRANEEVLLPNYLKYFTQTKRYRDWIAANSMRTGQPGINGNEYKELQLPLPPTKAEQTAIATALNDADALIQKLEQLIAKKRNIKTGAMQELLKPKEGWNVKKLKEVSHVSRENIIPYLAPKTIYAHFSLPAFDNNKTISFESGESIRSSKFKVPKDSILISKLNPRIPRIWMPSVIPENSIASTEFIILTRKEGITKEYLFSFCSSNSFSKQLEQAVTGTTGSHQRIKPEDAIQIEVPFPKDVTEQIKISSILSDMDNEIQELEKQLEKYKMMKQGMRQSLLTGKIRLV